MTIDNLSSDDEAAFAAMQAADIGGEDPEAEEPAELDAGAEEQPAEEDGAEGEEVEGKPQQRRLVSHAALHEEREKRKASEAEARQLREERARFDERLRVIQEMQQQPAADPEPEIPDPETDPIGAIKYWADAAKRSAQEARQREQQQTEAQQQNETYQRFVGEYGRQSSEYAKQAPEATQAYRFFVDDLKSQFEDEGYAPADAQRMAQQREVNIAHAAMQSGVNPLARITEIAKRRGWSPTQGGTAAEEIIDKTNKAMAGSKSLSSGNGGAGPVEMTAERLIKMSDEDFAAWTGKNPAKAARLLGA